MIVLPQALRVLALAAMVRASGVARLEDRQAAATTTDSGLPVVPKASTPASTTSTYSGLPVVPKGPDLGVPTTTTVYNPQISVAEFDPALASVTLVFTWGWENVANAVGMYVVTTVGWTSTYAPLTSVFTPPASCSLNYVVRSLTRDPPSVWVGSTKACYPPGYISMSYYSPGICPQGYTIADSGVLAASSQTHAYCCPTGYDINPGSSACYSMSNSLPTTLSGSTSPTSIWTITALYRHYLTPPVSGKLTNFVPHSDIYTTMAGKGPVQFIVTPVSIRWAATDKAVLDWLSTTAGSANSTSPASIAPRTGVNIGAIVGGAVGGLAVLGLAIAGVLIFCLRRRKRRRQSVPTEDPKPEAESKQPFRGSYPGIQEMPSSTAGRQWPLDAQPEETRHELAAQPAGVGKIHELATEQREGRPMLGSGYAPKGPYERKRASLAREGEGSAGFGIG
ncbi:hypothetical protein EJ06DRAFT_79794 [Trichodelitschia bisporula]|uniref:Uncharacterized protein n=1 Tax=Trichodelitschia bisporula TaxID=703511 RepID=A0A6G1HTY9_9PEZI|nr:hypothetical protein EJ06DRAFT_79794 [Trichodelitschia bisporula]